MSKLDELLLRAGLDIKGDLRIYNAYIKELETLNLSPLDYEKAVVGLAEILEI